MFTKHLLRLVNQAAKGHEFLIAKAGKSMVHVVPIGAPPALRRLGMLKGRGIVTVGLKKDFAAEIDAMFYAGRLPYGWSTRNCWCGRRTATPGFRREPR